MDNRNKSDSESENKINLFSVQFKSSDFEHLFRKHYLQQNKKHALILCSIFLILTLIFIISDYFLLIENIEIYRTLIIRAVHLVISLLLMYLIYKAEDEKFLDLFIFLWAITLTAIIFYIDVNRPSDYYFHAVIDVIVLFILYTALPNRFILQFTSGLALTITNFIIFSFFKNPIHDAILIVIVTSFLVANFLGIFISRQLHLNRRIEFLHLMNEISLRRELEIAFSDIKQLKGFLPICASCKNIRDDKGYWNEIETYIRDNSEAEFSHGLCPSCAKKLYPDIMDN